MAGIALLEGTLDSVSIDHLTMLVIDHAGTIGVDFGAQEYDYAPPQDLFMVRSGIYWNTPSQNIKNIKRFMSRLVTVQQKINFFDVKDAKLLDPEVSFNATSTHIPVVGIIEADCVTALARLLCINRTPCPFFDVAELRHESVVQDLTATLANGVFENMWRSVENGLLFAPERVFSYNEARLMLQTRLGNSTPTAPNFTGQHI